MNIRSNIGRGVLVGFVSLTALVGVDLSFAQTTYPNKDTPLKLVVPFGPGSATDILGRALAKAITDERGLPVIVENKPGADALIGVQTVLNAPADGNTLLLVSSSTSVLNPLMVPNQQFDMVRDFVPLVTIAKNHPAFNVGASTSFKSVREFIAAATANPRRYTYGSATTTSQLAGQLLEARTGIQMLNVPYKTTAAAMTALAAGEIDLVMVDASSAKAMYSSGRVRPLAVGAPTRLPGLPHTPTMIEEGITDYQITSWFATYFKAGTPADRVATMRNILARASKSPRYSDVLSQVNLEPFALVGDDISALTRNEIDMWGKVIRANPVQAK